MFKFQVKCQPCKMAEVFNRPIAMLRSSDKYNKSSSCMIPGIIKVQGNLFQFSWSNPFRELQSFPFSEGSQCESAYYHSILQ